MDPIEILDLRSDPHQPEDTLVQLSYSELL
jgi:hypothetical protein